MSEPLLRLEAVEKRFGETVALAGVELDVDEGEFVTLLGPSGCGKTTLLRVVAGFEAASAGRVSIGGRDYVRTPPYRRPVNMVFQRYVMFPHLSVFENVAFGLRVARVPRAEVARRVDEALALVRLSGYGVRRSDELSGGQAQRVSLARALVNRPQILLLDEPLSALDLKVRLEMQAELRRIHRQTGTTFLYVTHDQGEAMSMSDRVVVMNSGRIEQVGRPGDVYRRPASRFVASFVGDANLLRAEVIEHRDGECRVRLGSGAEVSVRAKPGTSPCWLALRPAELSLVVADAGDPALEGTVVDVAFLGSRVVYVVDVGADRVRVEESGRDAALVRPVGGRVRVAWSADAAALLPDDDASAAHVGAQEPERMGR